MANENKSTGLKLFNQAITNPHTQDYLASVLGERKGSFVNNLTALVANNTKLQACEPYTLMFAAMKATALALPLDNSLGFAYVIPYKNGKTGTTEAQFQLGYKGLKQLAMRTGQLATIPHATDVKEGELKKRNRLTGDCVFEFIEDDNERAKAKTIGYASYFRLKSGADCAYYMSVEEMKAHATKYSQTYRSKNDYVKNESRWTTEFDEMALKTVLKLNLSKNAPLSVELADAIRADQAIIRDGNKYDYVDNEVIGVSVVDDNSSEIAAKFSEFTQGEEIKE